MKQVFFLCCTVLVLTSCSSQESKAMKDQKEALEKLDEISPGSIRTTDGGWTMTAKINGKVWKATSMFPPTASGRVIGYLKKESISLPYNGKNAEAGKTIKFSENKAVDIFTNDDVSIWGGYEGEMVITKVNNGWAEGTFQTTARGNGKTLAVTDGFFRVQVVE